MVRAVIADDDDHFARLLEGILRETGRVEVVAIASSGVDCLRLCENTQPDVVFLDIEMPGLSGLDVAEAVLSEEGGPLVVFVTGHEEHALRAFELAAFDYVPKHLRAAAFTDRIQRTVDRVERERQHNPQPVEELQARLDQLAGSLDKLQVLPRSRRPSRLPVKDYEEGAVRLLDPDEIICAERVGRRTVIRTAESEYPTYYTIERLEQRLVSEGFVRVNPGALVNQRYVHFLVPNGDGSYDVILRDTRGSVFTASRARSKALLESLES